MSGDLICELVLALMGERGGVDDTLLGLWLPLVAMVLELARLEGDGEVPPLEQREWWEGVWLLLLFRDRHGRFLAGGGVESAASHFLLREKGVIVPSTAGILHCASDRGRDSGMSGGEGGVCGDSTSDSGEAGDSSAGGDTLGEWLSTPFISDDCVITSLLTHTSFTLDLCGSVA